MGPWSLRLEPAGSDGVLLSTTPFSVAVFLGFEVHATEVGLRVVRLRGPSPGSSEVQVGDLLVTLNGTPLSGVEGVKRLVDALTPYPEGMLIEVRRGDERYSIGLAAP